MWLEPSDEKMQLQGTVSYGIQRRRVGSNDGGEVEVRIRKAVY